MMFCFTHKTRLTATSHTFAVMCLVAWPLNESESGVDLFFERNLTAPLTLIPCNNKNENSIKKHKNGEEVSIKTRSTPASLVRGNGVINWLPQQNYRFLPSGSVLCENALD